MAHHPTDTAGASFTALVFPLHCLINQLKSLGIKDRVFWIWFIVMNVFGITVGWGQGRGKGSGKGARGQRIVKETHKIELHQ